MTATCARGIDAILDASVVGGFSSIGPAIRRRLPDWGSLARLDGCTVAITGATSGLGRSMAHGAVALGAEVVLVVRDVHRGNLLADELRAEHGGEAAVLGCDLSDLPSVADAASALSRRARLDAVVHNAGALTARRVVTATGDELTFATHVLGPYLLTAKLLPALECAGDARVVVVTSGGMYAQPLEPGALVRDDGRYTGTRTYARCKRAQVSLVDLHREAFADRGVTLVAYHPGWADTEGVRASLPRFRAVMRPVLRTPEQGADTALWLLGAPRAQVRAGALFCDRAPRPLHRLRRTARSDTQVRRRELDDLCRERCGLGEARS